jgi:uncharacterized protein (TIGR02453 family)
MPGPRFTPKTLAFLRALKRHNDREWFSAHRAEYDREVRAPMLAVIGRIAEDFLTFAPDLVASERVSLYRIYRDTRFSADKSPLKTHIAAIFPWKGLPKHEGAGLYFHVAPSEVWAGGGMYMPQTSQLQRVREHLAKNFTQFRAIVESPSFKRRTGGLDGERLHRVPRGFPADHPAAQYLRFRQFLAGRDFPASFATNPRFYSTLLAIFREIAPLIRFLNEPLLQAPRDPLLPRA